MRKPSDILSWIAVTVAACAATVLLFVLFAPALIVMGLALLSLGIVNRTTRIGRVIAAIGIVWFALGLTTSTVLVTAGTQSGGGVPVRAQAPDRHS